MNQPTCLFALISLFTLSGLPGCGGNQHPSSSKATNEMSTKQFEDHAKSLLSKIVHVLPPRNYRNEDGLNQTADLITKHLKQHGYQPRDQVFSVPDHDRQYKNVIAFYGDPEKPRLVVGAHYDVYGDFQGADDNASAVVGGLLLAERLNREKPDLPYAIEFCFYTLEEPPYFASESMGSFIHAKSLKDANTKVIGMVCLEMIGYFTDEPGSQAYPLPAMKLTYPKVGNFIAVVGNLSSGKLTRHYYEHLKASGMPTEKLTAPRLLTGIDFSDHRNYWHFKYPAVMVTDTSFYRNPNYHTSGDTIETIDFKKMCMVINGVYKGIIAHSIKS